MKYQILFSRKNKKNIISLSSAEFAHNMVSDNLYYRLTKVFPLKCDAPIDFEYQLTYLQPHQAFSVDPMTGKYFCFLTGVGNWSLTLKVLSEFVSGDILNFIFFFFFFFSEKIRLDISLAASVVLSTLSL